MSLISEVPLSNVTVYRRDYKKKEGSRPKPIIPERDYDDPLTGPHEEHVLPYRKYNYLLKPNKYPDPREYTEQVCEKVPGLRKYLKDPADGPDFDVIDHLYDNDNRSVYMVSYCHLGDFESKVSESRRTKSIPEGWEIPETTQKCNFRDPKLVMHGGIAPVKMKRPAESLRPNEKERAILGVKTGDSEYMSCIGRTGGEIIEGKLHGDINIRPQFSQDELLRAMLIRRE